MDVQKRRQKLAHELGVLSQLVYKHCSAHRSTKYFQALKKVDRHMYEFSKLKVFDIANCDRSENAEYRKRRAVALLVEVEGNSMEVIRRCLPELALTHFITFHSLVVASISNLFVHIKAIKVNIQNSMKSGSGRHTRLKFPIHGSRSGPNFGVYGNDSVDLGVRIPRNEASKMRPTKNWTSPCNVTTAHELDVGIPISRELLKNNPISAVAQYTMYENRNNEPAMGNLIKCDKRNAPVQKHLGVSNAEDTKHAYVVKEVTSSPGDVTMIPKAPFDSPPTVATESDTLVMHVDSPTKKSLGNGRYLTKQKTIATSISETDKRRTLSKSREKGRYLTKQKTIATSISETDKRTLSKSRELKINSHRNMPLCLKQYHLRFLLHCYRKNWNKRESS